jgi:hypothetical protein
LLLTKIIKEKRTPMIARIAKIPPVSPVPPAEQNHEVNCGKTAGDISNTGDIIPLASKTTLKNEPLALQQC